MDEPYLDLIVSNHLALLSSLITTTRENIIPKGQVKSQKGPRVPPYISKMNMYFLF